MCGIIGIASREPVADRGWLDAGRDAMRHRGPDAAGTFWSGDGRVGFGHRRLAIIDLSPAGGQPMRDAREELCITFNGEIFNFLDLRRELEGKGHSFRSHSDTEVILAAYRQWGTECPAVLNGQFAFALHDARERRVLLARDRAGEKPLFYAVGGGALRFASELKGLMAAPDVSRRIDPAALDCYLALGFVPGDRCILRGASKLPPAHALLFDLDTGSSRTWRYWRLPESSPDATAGRVDEGPLLDRLEVLLEDSVRRQMVADVPVGVLLSGGVDSSLVTAMAVRARPKVKTFTVCFPGHGAYDEAAHARLIARHFGTEHVELEAAESTVDLLPVLARQFDEPMADSSMIPTYLVSRLIREHCTVALGGDGGDELFAGYPHYSRLLWMQKRLGWIPRGLRAPVATAGTFLPVGLKGRNWLSGLGVDLRTDVPLIASQFDARSRRRLLSGHGRWNLVAEEVRRQRVPGATDLVRRATQMDFENYLPEDILVKVDRASMLNSLEVRAPFLDHRLIEFAFGQVPSALRATVATGKILLKDLTTRVLPAGFERHRKQGFSIPLSTWLRAGPWRDYFHDVLTRPDQRLFARPMVSDLLQGQQKGRANSERLFSLVMFELWRREYGVTL